MALWARVGGAIGAVQGPVEPPVLSADPRARPRPQAGFGRLGVTTPFGPPSRGVAPWLGSCRP